MLQFVAVAVAVVGRVSVLYLLADVRSKIKQKTVSYCLSWCIKYTRRCASQFASEECYSSACSADAEFAICLFQDETTTLSSQLSVVTAGIHN